MLHLGTIVGKARTASCRVQGQSQGSDATSASTMEGKEDTIKEANNSAVKRLKTAEKVEAKLTYVVLQEHDGNYSGYSTERRAASARQTKLIKRPKSKMWLQNENIEKGLDHLGYE